MKKTTFLLLCFFAVFCVKAQQETFFCGNEDELSQNPFITTQNLANDPYSYSVDPAYLASFDPITFNIFFWGINDDQGNSEDPMTGGGVTGNEILK